MIIKSALAVILVLFATIQSFGQVSTRYNPNYERDAKGIYVKTESTEEFQIFIDKSQLKDLPANQYGIPEVVEINPKNSGRWYKASNGRIWKLQIRSTGAKSLNLSFSSLYIPLNSRLFIYTEDGQILMGPISHEFNTKKGTFLTDLLPGESVVLEYFEHNLDLDKSRFTIDKVIHGIDQELAIDSRTASTCEIEVSCPEGANWTDQSEGTVMILYSNGKLCSGALLNDACQDWKPYILSAFHCFDIGDNLGSCGNGFWDGTLDDEQYLLNNMAFRIGYKTSSCNGSITSYETLVGGDFVAGHEDYDFILLEADNRPSASTSNDIRYLAWDAGSISSSSGALLHHPGTSITAMEITTYNTSANLTSSNLTDQECSVTRTLKAGNYINFTRAAGSIKQGSSGAPLFNVSKKIMGVLSAGFAGCGPNPNLYAGSFAKAWQGKAAIDEQLKYSLTNQNAIVLSQVSELPYPTVQRSGSSSLVVGTSNVVFNLKDAPPSVTHTVSWSVTGSLTIVSSSHSSITVKYNGSGGAWSNIRATITNKNSSCTGSTLFSKGVQAGPFSSPQITVSGNERVCPGNLYTYTAVTPIPHESGWSYSWTYPSGWSVHGQWDNQILLYVPLYSTNYGPVRASVNNGQGASGYSGITTYPNFSCGGYYLTVEPPEKVYPNPSDGIITLPELQSGVYSMQIIDQKGMILEQKTLNVDGPIELDLSTYHDGLYILSLSNADSTREFRVIIE